MGSGGPKSVEQGKKIKRIMPTKQGFNEHQGKALIVAQSDEHRNSVQSELRRH